jgi:hypothetical protein
LRSRFALILHEGWQQRHTPVTTTGKPRGIEGGRGGANNTQMPMGVKEMADLDDGGENIIKKKGGELGK